MITRGNADVDGMPFGHWFLGDYRKWLDERPAPVEIGLRQSSRLELKWGFHKAGETRADWASISDKRTVSILVRGKFLIRLRSPASRAEVTDVRLEREGDYAIWGTDLEHTWVVEEDSVILTVRWLE